MDVFVCRIHFPARFDLSFSCTNRSLFSCAFSDKLKLTLLCCILLQLIGFLKNSTNSNEIAKLDKAQNWFIFKARVAHVV